MKEAGLISKTENYARRVMEQQEGTLIIAHDFKHVDRVRNWALVIADTEKFPDVEMVEVTALLHDIGLGHLNDGDERKEHGPVGAEIAEKFLHTSSKLNAEDIELIIDAIRYHGLSPSTVDKHLGELGDKGRLLEIIRDADNLDALGAIGIMRASKSHYYLPEYDPLNIKGVAWGLSSRACREKFGQGLAPVIYIIDQVNQQIRHYNNLHTMTAKNLGQPLVKYMKDFVIQLECEIDHQTTS